MDVISIDETGGLSLSPDIDDWETITSLGISAVIDLDGDLDVGVPTAPNHLIYIYLPFDDGELPDSVRLHAVGQLGAQPVANGQKVLCHCLMGLNRSALIAGLILVHLGMGGSEAAALIQQRRPGALYNPMFMDYLSSLPPHDSQGTHTIRMDER